MVKLLKFSKTNSEKKHKNTAYTNPSFIDIFPEAMGLFFDLKTLLSNYLSNISLTTQPADLIKTEPKKNKVR